MPQTKTETAASQGVAKQIPVEPIPSSDPGSLGNVLDRLQNQRVYSGHPADLENPEEPAALGTESKPSEGSTGVEPSPEIKPEQEPAKPSPKPEPETPEGWPFSPKYKSHLDAEIGARETARMAHEKAEEAAKLRREREELQKQLDELQKGKQSQESVSDKSVEELQGLVKSALEEISNLDPYDADYQEKSSQVWAKTLAYVQSQARLNEADLEAAIERQLQKRQPHSDQTGPTDNQMGQGDPNAEMVNAATDMAKQAGLDMTPGSLDYELFWSKTPEAPKLSFEEQVAWVSNEVKRLRNLAAEAERARIQKEQSDQEKARQMQINNTPLERGGMGYHPPSGGTTMTTINSTLEQLRQRRTL